MPKKVRFVDLFAGLGGMRYGFETACHNLGIPSECVFTSEIKKHAVKSYEYNFVSNHKISGDITKEDYHSIPDFDYLLAGFPCQSFSSAGKRHGFLDPRGTLFFNVLEILREKSPQGFLLENVAGLVKHDSGNTFKTIISSLTELGYNVSWNLIDSALMGIPQRRLRVYIVGHKNHTPVLDKFIELKTNCSSRLDFEYHFTPTKFSNLLTSKYSQEELYGKYIQDKRGGKNSIHSWDIELKGSVSSSQKILLEEIMKERRKKKWAEQKGVEWMDGIPLTLEDIKSFHNYPTLESDLNYLTECGYLKLEHPKDKFVSSGKWLRLPKDSLPKGYNIVTGRLSFPINYILEPNSVCPTLVASEAGRIGVSTKFGVRPLTVKEGLFLSGFPLHFGLHMISYQEAFDLIGNTVIPPVVAAVSSRLLKPYTPPL